MTSTNGLDNLLYIGNKVDLFENRQLVEIVGFENISTLPGGLVVEENEALPNLTGFESLTHVGGDVQIIDNISLTSIQGLDNLETIGETIDIDGNPVLTNLDDLSNLNSVGENIYVTDNEGLVNITGLSSIVNFNGYILINDNPILMSLEGLENISANDITNLVISNCDSLSFCSLENICQYLNEDIGPAHIVSNNSGCNSEPQITATCAVAGIHEVLAENLFSVYPNPFLQEATLESKILQSGTEVHFYNYLGNRVKSIYGFYGTQIRIDRTGLPEGLYLLKIVQGNEVIGLKKIVVK